MKTISMFRAGAAFAALMAPLGTAAAQDAAPQEAPQDFGEIVVTAQRRAQSLQDVGISVAAFAGEELKSRGVESSLEIARLTPGVHISGNVGGQNSQFTIRGVTQNDFNDAIEAPVAVYVDDGYIPNLQGQTFGLFDLERVEVLKGPQGTLFGRNATGGLVHYVINKPSDTLEGSIDGTYGRFNQVRINPRTTPGEVKSQFAAFIADLRAANPDLDLDWEMYGSTPGGTTDPSNWIIQSARRGWETIEEAPYRDPDLLGGQTDGAALRRLGVPTARIGWPWPATGSPEPIAEGLGGMGATYVPDLMPCARKIMYAVIDTLTRSRGEMGL